MKTISLVLVAVVAVLHVWFLVLEMFLWNTPFGHKSLRMEPAVAATTAPLAKNQGLYNGFLAAGLAWSFFAAQPQAFQLQLFFLGCVLVAGLYGATMVRMILFIQAIPAALALAAVWMAGA